MNWSVYKYVQQFFQSNFPEWYLLGEEHKRGFTKCVDELLENGRSITDLKRGMYDDELKQKLDDYVNNYLTLSERKDCLRLYEYIYNLVKEKSVVNFKYNSNILDYIIKDIMNVLFPQYSESRLGTSDFEQLILEKYKEESEELYQKLSGKIDLYLNRTLDFYQVLNDTVKMDDLVNYVVEQILIDNNYEDVLKVIKSKLGDSKGKSSIEKMIDNYADKYISMCNRKSAVEKNTTKNEDKQNISPLDYIGRLIWEYYGSVNDELLSTCATVVYNKLMYMGYSATEIVNEEMDGFIVNLIHDYFNQRQARINASKNSVKNDKSPSKIKFNRKRKQINKTVISLALVATLVGYGVSNIATNIHDYNAKKNIALIDDYYYSNIHTIYAQSFQPTLDNVINTFDDYSQFDNENFKYLGFYQAYRSVKEDRLYIMDNMLSDIKREVRGNDKYSSLYSSIMYNGCYLDFMYDRLYDMGFEEIKDKKYQDLLDEYLLIKVNHPYEDAVKYLSPVQQKLLEKVRDKYIELSEKCLVELGEVLDDLKDASLDGGVKKI